MIDLKVIMENGDYFYTKINCPEEEARQYYVGNLFNFCDNLYHKKDKMVKCVDIEVMK